MVMVNALVSAGKDGLMDLHGIVQMSLMAVYPISIYGYANVMKDG